MSAAAVFGLWGALSLLATLAIIGAVTLLRAVARWRRRRLARRVVLRRLEALAPERRLWQ